MPKDEPAPLQTVESFRARSMSSSTAPPDAQPQLKTLGVGLLLGLLIAFGFALIIRLVPESWLTDLGFFPDLYGKTGDAWAYTAAGLLWAFGWIAVTELVVEQRRPTH